jgi:hypothetical protein
VTDLQLLLRCPDLTGVLDVETRSRLRGWQMVHGLEITGVVDVETARTLGWPDANPR